MGKRRERPQIRIVAHFMKVNGVLVEIDPIKAGIPDRCKKVVAEIMSGKKYELVDRVASSS
ncbi:hypothetical protein [Cohnella sp. AR92]|uniref:hypothetical protein n=1 Tax=Cohnella sp. AR92 TaxID=648716 RepID=UPI000F8C4D95|nr:hypothetical protein [Cohnella sp. AR92]RUS43590.1 hypothetical protein ELR57_25010 [Cohnella sp. AR92]